MCAKINYEDSNAGLQHWKPFQTEHPFLVHFLKFSYQKIPVVIFENVWVICVVNRLNLTGHVISVSDRVTQIETR